MYRIQGSDNKEYGPIPAETIRQWIGERRLNRASLAARDGEGVWQPLGQMAEFNDAFPAEAVAAAPSYGYNQVSADPAATRAAALAAVKVPALMLVIFGIISLIACIAMSALSLAGNDIGQLMMKSMGINMPPPPPEQAALQATINRVSAIAQLVLGIPWNIFVIVGARRMMRLQGRNLAMTSAVLSIIPCFSICCLITMPIGIWAVVTLGKPEVKSEFT
jgi:hypothetical protein